MSVKRNASAVITAGLIFGFVIGAALGVLWWRLAPRIEVVVESGQLVDFQTQGFLASDISYGALAIVAGLLVTIGLARMRREHLLSVLVAGVLSGLVGSLAMWWIGHYLGRVDIAGLAGTQSEVVEGPLVLHLGAMLLIWPIVAAMVVTVLAFEDWLAGLKKKS
ncbi:unannotated protein [freshwater metagenome]|uniref:Unannotated protein n=1 Tax=freshwater metagenome TaxID=449393 RepID=A0A6J7FU80_9ZZZZ|nr:hypothetical protein [Actinomycetota bacterium]